MGKYGNSMIHHVKENTIKRTKREIRKRTNAKILLIRDTKISRLE